MNKYKKICLRIITILFIIIFMILPNIVDAKYTLVIPGEKGSIFSAKASKIMAEARGTVQVVAETIAVIILIYIGIKYILSAPEGRAEYRKILVPYVIGVILIYKADDIIKAIQGNDYKSEFTTPLNGVKDAFVAVGEIIAIIVLIYIGIRYMMMAPEGKAEYRKIMVPYVIGAIIVFTTAYGSNFIINAIKVQAGVQGASGNNFEEETVSIFGTILTVMRYVGVGMALLMLIVLALKYITSAPEGKAEFTKTAVPYVVGAVVLFASSSIIEVIRTVAEEL